MFFPWCANRNCCTVAHRWKELEWLRCLKLAGRDIGRFVPEKFEALFQKFAKSDKNKLLFDELYALTSANKNAVDPFGWTAEKLEWGITYLLLKDQGGYVTKEQIRGMYDGSLFETIAKQREQSKIHKKKL